MDWAITPSGLIRIGAKIWLMPDRDKETGRYTGEYSDQDFLNAITEQEGIAGTGEIADRIGCAHDTAYKRLQQMEDHGIVSSKKVGNTLLWEEVDD